jgi:hypothetical protein
VRQGRAGPGEMACTSDRGEAEEGRGGAEEEEGEKKPGTILQNFESSGVYL